MISLNKRSKKVGAQEDKIPLNANPYQLSVSFLHKFLSRYQPDVYISIKKFLRNLTESPNNTIEIAFGSEGGAAATVATLASLGILKMKIEVPEQVVVLDPNLSQNNAKFASMVEKYKQHHDQTYGNVKMNEVLNVKKDVKKAKNSGNLQQGVKRKHSEMTEDDDNDEILFNEEPPEKGQLMAARSGSRLALFMKDEVANNDGNIQHSYDYFVVASSNITVRLKNKLDYKSDMDVTSKCDLSGSSSESNKPKLYNFVDGKGILGATISDVMENFEQPMEELKNLIKNGQIFRVG